MIGRILLISFTILFVSTNWATGTGYQITFQTTGCKGDTGIASVDVSAVYRIEQQVCDPPHEQEKRQQVLVRSTQSGSYDVFTVTDDQAKIIQQEIQTYMRAKLRMLEQGKALLIEK